MERKKSFHRTTLPLAIFITIMMLTGTLTASAAKEAVLHHFGNGSDGQAPYGRVISDAAGNLYGTTAFGGTPGLGIVFELTNPGGPAGWSETVLYNFAGGSDGSRPYGGLIFDSAGNLYGTTYYGGTSNAGTVYQLAPPVGRGGAWTETVLYSFAGYDGMGPQGDLIFDQEGNLYGTTSGGGSRQIDGFVFQLAPPTAQGGAWTEHVVWSFYSILGTSPRAGLIFGSNGWLYGTLANGGRPRFGAVFRLKPPPTKGGSWSEKTLYRFSGGADGSSPLCSLILFKGSLYGTTVKGGASDSGVIFQLTPPASHHGPWVETVLHSFTCGSDGCLPWAGLTMDKNGVFYGTTQYGGLPSNGGTVFQLKQESGTWTESVLFSFKSSSNQLPAAGLLLGGSGTLYGTTVGEGGNAGIVFKLLP